MASSMLTKTLKTLNPYALTALTSTNRQLSVAPAARKSEDDAASFTFSSGGHDRSKSSEDCSGDEKLYIKGPKISTSSVTIPVSFMTGSIVGKRFYQKVTTREADDVIGWSVMLDYRTLKTPSKRNLKCPTLALAKAIADEWEYQLHCRLYSIRWNKTLHNASDEARMYGIGKSSELQVEKFGPLIKWVESEFGFKPVVYTSIFGGKQEEGLVEAVENVLKKTDDCELAAIAAAAHSLIIAIGIFRGRLNIQQPIELIRLEEDLQVDRWGLVEGGHDVDIADLRVQISSAAFFLGLSRKN
ncbi:ATP synthase mitochondrial F1 complex assembly factor 2 [Striga asiatica]|uniref:ATP synthase mitochondrial F1 complex assembly factor 2 n=1 Tax=Striga asiatica TaxID=4170 RepID=A0A5A7PKR8_STRAF|nr:ATP synthase mitochondrial F1 complex assembly factor 2 [Striga asiatica]